MRLIIPPLYRGGELERQARAAFNRVLTGDDSHIRRLDVLPRARVINITDRYRLFSLDEGNTWKLLKHPQYTRNIRKWRTH
ncbi:hypothetical protein [Edwardsiella ictaluri]|uniref:ParE-like toxin domain-containing protein n=1 Tax=Edwardsiella ictaluri (strain 93-146) TaxID=634503 RepID=C5BGY7_EDWI9|nr:hypothetical protein [Edwardsiella ictaluri]ACR69418.1 hypothetical protein NT01EI_2244 [Edwardsiella ictaluri 93-146]EKS7764143.1 hypothetical protein [Edwardsiella ictaluri]EKS7774094.1 hypothetical protein [Edwardsiella ictaluri]EKS7777427.1 hypothetical protein [Edwardsiella ictaluri]EKS7790801.1 hypothetical protein [Edwardsiella ictaluri]